MKRGLITFSLILILSLSVVSAFSFSDFWNKITGRVVLAIGVWYFYPSSPNSENCVNAGQVVFNEAIGEDLGECCEDLVEIGDVFYDEEKTCDEIFMLVGYSSICSDCGNGNCEEWENKCNCQSDCE